MRFYGRALIVYLSIIAILYGTTNVWPWSEYTPSHSYYKGLKAELNDPKGGFQSAGGQIYVGGRRRGTNILTERGEDYDPTANLPLMPTERRRGDPYNRLGPSFEGGPQL